MGLTRLLPALALSCIFSTPLLAQPAGGGDAAPPLKPAAPAVNPVVQAVDSFWHFGKIAKYEQAAAEGQKVLGSGASSADLLAAFEQVASERREDLYDTLYKWVNVEPMKAVTEQVLAKLAEGRKERFQNPQWIRQQVERLSVNSRAFEAAIQELRNSGEFAAPVMIDVLRDDGAKQFHSATRAGLVRLGRQVLNPLVPILESKDQRLLFTVMGVLGEIKYDVAAPYIARVYATKQAGMEEVKSAAGRALGQLGYADPAAVKPADLFAELAEKFYYSNASIVPDTRFPEAAHIWYWDDSKGLTSKDVPPQIFNEIMSMRCSEYSLKLEPNRGDVVSLWLAANNKREADLPEGKADTTHEGPDAHFYNVSLGTQYCNTVLTRALRDRTPAVALKVIRSLQEIAGQSNLFVAGENAKEPVVDGMQFPNREVRFESAIALGAALPSKAFVGQELVVPTLAEAISSTGKPNVVIVMADANAANGLKEALKDAARAETGSDPNSASEAAGRLPSVDLLIVDSRNNPQTDAVLAGARVRNVPKIVIVEDKASPYVTAEFENPLLSTLSVGTNPVDAAALTEAITKARAKAGSAPMDDKAAEAFAQRAAALLKDLAIAKGVLDVMSAQPSLLRSLEDSRVEIAKSGAAVLGYLPTKEAQTALAAKGSDEKAGDDLKIACFKALARNAKTFGNLLDADQVELVQKAVEGSANLQIRSAAGEAQGALNLAPERAKNLIIQQSQIGK